MVVVVKWSACSPSTPTIRVRSLQFPLWKNCSKIRKKRPVMVLSISVWWTTSFTECHIRQVPIVRSAESMLSIFNKT